MEGLFSLLLFAAFFFLMMRFGCGAHIAHGRHGQHTPAGGNDTDPVCGMEVPPDSGYSKVHQGSLYRFCSRSCLDKFDANPQQYLDKGKEAS
ncbi:MAG: YHS domain-containing protein [Burkholderiales bacterium]|jgi:YHS domain-containing protein